MFKRSGTCELKTTLFMFVYVFFVTMLQPITSLMGSCTRKSRERPVRRYGSISTLRPDSRPCASGSCGITRFEGMLHFYLWVFLPLAVIPTSYLYVVPEPNESQFDGLELEVFKRYTTNGFLFILYDRNPFGFASTIFAISLSSEAIFIVWATFRYYFPLMGALKKAMKESRFETATTIKSNLVKLRIIIIIPMVLGIWPFVIPMVLNICLPEHLLGQYIHLMGYFSVPVILTFFMASSVNCVYQSYNFKKNTKITIKKVIANKASTNSAIK
uniref:G protein-coupled receptor n=2 Tax=Rhabditophanes sp. KR3021 TaxID=114890 RepID=A0AC35TVM8_9BILA